MSASESGAKHKKFPKKVLVIGVIVVIVLLLGVGAYFFFEYRKAQANPSQAAQAEIEQLVTEVGKLMVLPSDEEPQVATVSDITKLKEQPFFAKAQNGYKVLIYTKAKKAILYDPVAKKLIEVAPVNLADATSPTPAAPVVVALYNGTTVTGLTTTVENELQEKGANVTVSTKSNASQSDYETTLVIDLTGQHAAQANELAQLLNGEVGQLPAGETKPENSEILIILGR
ncbi:MAG TPA: LytR C-terminal domain-containing protein [Patescibacteria group bacterium]|nr:LytR C-terminal domain-containing protein [Patescibacteria group bacterium]